MATFNGTGMEKALGAIAIIIMVPSALVWSVLAMLVLWALGVEYAWAWGFGWGVCSSVLLSVFFMLTGTSSIGARVSMFLLKLYVLPFRLLAGL